MVDRNRGWKAALGKTEIPNGELATEDWNSFKNHVSNFLSIFENEAVIRYRNAEDIKKEIVSLRGIFNKKSGTIRQDAPPVKLRSYAKWLSKNGHMVTSADQLLKAINESLPIVAAFGKPWWDAYVAMLEYAELKVLRNAFDNPGQTREKMRKTFQVNQPHGFNGLLKNTGTVTSPVDGGRTTNLKMSDFQLGDWYATAHPVYWGFIDGTFPVTQHQQSPVRMAEMQILDKNTIDKLLHGIDSMLDKLAFNDYTHVIQAQRSLQRYALRFRTEEMVDVDEGDHQTVVIYDRNELSLMADIEGYVEHLILMARHNNAQEYVLHTCAVILKWIDQSFKRMD